jgi:hypothetical protein
MPTSETERGNFMRLDDPGVGVTPLAMVGADLPLWTQNGSYGAVLDRLAIETMTTAGVRGPAALAVTQRAAGANLSVDVAPGVCAVSGTDTTNQGRYLCRSTAVNNLTVGGPPTAGLTRIDRIVARVYDTAVVGGSVNAWQLEVVAGTPAASPSPPAIPASSLALARVSVPAGLASVTTANITDDRVAMAPASNPGGWHPYTPGFYGNSTASNIGNGTLTGRYKLLTEKTVAFACRLQLGSTTALAAGDIRLTLPAGMVPAGEHNAVLGSGFIVRGGKVYPTLVAVNQSWSPPGFVMYSPGGTLPDMIVIGSAWALALNENMMLSGLAEIS